MPIGKPGFLDSDTISSILREIRGTEKQELHVNEKIVRAVLEKALFALETQG